MIYSYWIIVLTLCLKVFETCAPDLQVNGTLQATYKVGRKTRESCNENYFFDFFFNSQYFRVYFGLSVVTRSLLKVLLEYKLNNHVRVSDP